VVHRYRRGDTHGQCDPSVRPAPVGDDTDREGTARGLCRPYYRATTRHPQPPVTRPLGSRRRVSPIRLSVGRELGRDIDGAWWPRADRITNELPNLVAVLTPVLGDITYINVNWSPLQRPPDFNWPGWEHKRQHVMTVSGRDACANLLIIPYATHSGLALMVLRCAANLPIQSVDRDKPAYLTAGSILRAAQQQRAPAITNPNGHTDVHPACPVHATVKPLPGTDIGGV
jgi:hypothetical protein